MNPCQPLATTIGNLAHAQRELLRTADAVPVDQWQTRPAEGRRSAGELVGHLSAIERAILHRTDRLLQKPPKPMPFFKRFHVPMMIVEARVIRRKAPTARTTDGLQERRDAGATAPSSGKNLSFIEETMERDLSKYTMGHPFLGTLNAYEWLQFIASHEIRHTKQMREIVGTLPKTVTILEK